MPDFGWLFDCIGQPDTCALFYPDTDEDEARATRFFNNCLPDALGFLKKIAFQLRQVCGGDRDDQMRTLERALSKELICARKKEGDLDRLEGDLHQVTKAFDRFAAGLALIKTLQNTVAINASNLCELLGRFNIPNEGLPAAWRAIAVRAVEQLAADDRYYEIAAREAEITLRILEVRAQMERDRTERKANELAQQRNQRLALLAVLVAAVGTALTLASDDTVKALIRWVDGRDVSAPPSFWELLLAKLAMLIPIIALIFCCWFGCLWLLKQWKRRAPIRGPSCHRPGW
jgi:hypothetical protein